jgi:hypothetical protein
MKKSVICHLFYPQIGLELLSKLALIRAHIDNYFVNIQGGTDEHFFLLNEAKNKLGNPYILTCPNQGRDIGAKLMLLDLLFQLNIPSDYTLIVHDKKSPHLENGDKWRNELFKIIELPNLTKIFDTFENNQDVGIIGAANYIQNEHKIDNTFACNSNKQIKEILKKYRIITNDYNFVAGNVFWIRTVLLKKFFSERPLINIKRDLELRNVLDFTQGTYIHAWERIMSWIATSQGYKIYGI